MYKQIFLLKNNKSYEKPVLMAYRQEPMAARALEEIRSKNQENADNYEVEKFSVADFNPNLSVIYMVCNKLSKDTSLMMFYDPFKAGEVVQSLRKEVRNKALHKKIFVNRIDVK